MWLVIVWGCYMVFKIESCIRKWIGKIVYYGVLDKDKWFIGFLYKI